MANNERLLPFTPSLLALIESQLDAEWREKRKVLASPENTEGPAK